MCLGIKQPITHVLVHVYIAISLSNYLNHTKISSIACFQQSGNGISTPFILLSLHSTQFTPFILDNVHLDYR